MPLRFRDARASVKLANIASTRMWPFTSRQRPLTAPLFLFNTLSGELETFVPRGRVVKMYNCGPTVYDYQHIGNMRPYVFADTLRRALELNGYKVKQVINLTDVGHLTGENEGNPDVGEDKVEKKAREEGETVETIVSRVTKAYYEDLDRLNIDRHKIIFARATDHIREQIALVKTLEEKGHTYQIADGIYFDTSKFRSYGKLGNIDIEGLKEGARVEKVPGKRRPTDFALWKFSPKKGIRQQEWGSPWGVGFPGWHLECSAIAMSLLGQQIDIHTGGIDHIPIHHNNEIAEAECATGKQFSRYWLHNAFITVEGKKIAKSVGNTIYVRNIIDRGLSPLSLRLWFLGGHYRSPMNFTWEALEGSQTALVRLHRHFVEELGAKVGSISKKYGEEFRLAINNDLDTPKALAILWEVVKDASLSKEDKRATLLSFDRALGLGLSETNEKLLAMLAGKEHRLVIAEIPADIVELSARREKARTAGDFAEADRIRAEAARQGYQIEDTPLGPRFKKI